MEWNDVNKGYPQELQPVLVYVEDPCLPGKGFTTIASWDGETWYDGFFGRCWWTFPGYRDRAKLWAYIPHPSKEDL